MSNQTLQIFGRLSNFQIGTITSVDYTVGSSVTITGYAPNQKLNFVLAAGPKTQLAIGTVSTATSGNNPSATVTGTAPNYTLNLVLPPANYANPLFSGTTKLSGTLVFSGSQAPAFVADWKRAIEAYSAGGTQTIFETYVGAVEGDLNRIAFFASLARVGGTMETMILNWLQLAAASGGKGMTLSAAQTQLATLRTSAQGQTV